MRYKVEYMVRGVAYAIVEAENEGDAEDKAFNIIVDDLGDHADVDLEHFKTAIYKTIGE